MGCSASLAVKATIQDVPHIPPSITEKKPNTLEPDWANPISTSPGGGEVEDFETSSDDEGEQQDVNIDDTEDLAARLQRAKVIIIIPQLPRCW